MDISSNEIKILKSLQTNLFGKRIDSNNMTIEVISNNTKIRNDVVKHCINQLIEKQLIEINVLDLNVSKIKSYIVTPSGNDFLDNMKSKTLNKYLWSILVPFFISVLGTLVTNYLSNN